MVRKYDEDLFEGTKMTFGEHLEELRVCLIRSLLGVAVGVLVGMLLGNYAVGWVKKPVEAAMDSYYQERSAAGMAKKYGELSQETTDALRARKLVHQDTWIEVVEIERLMEQLERRRQAPASPVPASPVPASPVPASPVPASPVPANPAPGVPAPAAPPSSAATTATAPVAQTVAADPPSSADGVAASASGPTSGALSRETQAATGVANPAEKTAPTAPAPSSAAPSSAAPSSAATSTAMSVSPVMGADQSEPGPPTLEMVKTRLWRQPATQTRSLSMYEPFMIWLKASMILGVGLAGPWVFYQIWLFVAAGLYPHERKYVYLYLPISLGLFVAGILLAYYGVFPPVLAFLLDFNDKLGIDPEPRINDWISFALLLPLGFGFSFQLPLVMLFLERLGILSVQMYTQNWRMSVLVICFISMILTPAEPISMILMAVPLCLLYLFGLGLCKWMPRHESPFGEGYEPE